jgi:pimeloyl-ACP methyl ester carboxylesterase
VAFTELHAGQRIHYELIDGPSERPLLVFLHEGLGCTAMWKDFPRLLCAATGHPGLVYDRLGYGQSSPFVRSRTIHYLHESAIIELPALLGTIVPGREHVLIGHSDGGSIALLYAAQRPAGLCGVITEAAHVMVEPETVQGIEATVTAYEAGKLRGLTRYHGDKTAAVFRAWSDTWLSPWFRSWSIEYALPSIQGPVLALQGARDQYGTAAQTAAIAATVRAGRVVMIENSGHTPHLDQMEVVLELMRSFVMPQHLLGVGRQHRGRARLG